MGTRATAPPDAPTRSRELACCADGALRVAGVDEAGRGALAGPVVAAAVIFGEGGCPPGVNDSKRLTPADREALFHGITDTAWAVSVGIVSPRRIDEINILRASHEAMAIALRGLPALPCVALVDGLPVKSLPCPQQAIVHGDALECCIAAASIVAKVTRDRMMGWYHTLHAPYGFNQHKGYATPSHRLAIGLHGLSAIHRRSFCRPWLEPAAPVQLSLELAP